VRKKHKKIKHKAIQGGKKFLIAIHRVHWENEELGQDGGSIKNTKQSLGGQEEKLAYKSVSVGQQKRDKKKGVGPKGGIAKRSLPNPVL